MKIKFVLGALLFIATANAADMCVSNDAVMVVLDPQIAGTTSSYDTTSMTWSVQFSYGVVSGTVGCGATKLSTGAVATGDVTSSSETSGYCYCKMLHPVESMWVRGLGAWNNVSNCISLCATNVNSNLAVRQGMFGNIVQ